MWRWLGFSQRWESGAWRWAAFAFGVLLVAALARGRGDDLLESAVAVFVIYVCITYMFPRFVSVSSIGIYAACAAGVVVAGFMGRWQLAGALAVQGVAHYGLMWLGWKTYGYKAARAARWELRGQLAEVRSALDACVAEAASMVPRMYPNGEPFPVDAVQEVQRVATRLTLTNHPDMRELLFACTMLLQCLAALAKPQGENGFTVHFAEVMTATRNSLLQEGFASEADTLREAYFAIIEYHRQAGNTPTEDREEA
ncbi:hypothetical protein OOK44_00755 [Streptomyces cellulosae]|jgi:hypothetical protein|uniref:hypothetical protein n=1 Tax=Streptomyces cellulosae TaxID=1968 RepID=UPI0022535993|nr:hypothetical protein [Streptomyces cellulosae]WSB51816.1 hypothetical protein OHA00_32860 [Streptomyces cellulosae]WTB85861.1 hypothetical protein OG837_33530 [Streptomyces cellulosae]WUC40481.1 hypothetical protein OG692_00630 [Streptomyces cellulosae]